MKLYYFIYENGTTLKTYISKNKEEIEKKHTLLTFDARRETSKKINSIIEIDSEKLNII